MNLLPSLSFSAPARAGASLTDDIRKGGSLRMRAPQSTGCLVEAAEAAQQAAEEEESVQAESSPHRPASISVPRNSGAGTGNDSSEAGHKLPSHSSSSFHDDVEGRSCESSHMHMERVPNDALPEMVAPPLDRCETLFASSFPGSLHPSFGVTKKKTRLTFLGIEPSTTM
jgi:hypothetical protein